MTRRRRTALGLAIVLAAGPGRAASQSIGDLLPIAVPGFAVAPGVTVLSRLQRDAASRGIVPGPAEVTIDPSLGAGFGIDSATGGTSTASGLLRAEPGVSVTDPAIGLVGFADAAISRYPADQAASANDITAGIGLDLPLGPDTATIGIARVATQQSGLGLSQSGSAAPFGVVLNDGRVALRLPLGRLDATERIEIGRATLGRSALAAAFHSRTTLRLSSEIATQDDAVLRGLALIKASLARYQGALPGSGFPNETAVALLGGVETSPDGIFRLRALGGAVRQSFAAGAGTRPGITTIGAIGLGWTPDGLVSAELDLTREAGVETTLGTPGSAVTSADLILAEAFTRDLTLTARLDARAGSVARHQASEIDMAAGMAWQVSPRIAFTPRLSYAIRRDLPGSAPREAVATMTVVWTP